MAGLLDFVLPAIFSAGDSAKRQIKGLLGDPVGTVKQFVNNKNDQAAAYLADVNLSTQGRMAGLLGEQVTPEQLAADQRVNQALANAYNPAGMIVWHGSPHNFTKFDASKIGTGEGSQAYGHGLYLAEEPTVARSYSMLGAKPGLRQQSTTGRGDWGVVDAMIKLGANKYTGGDVDKFAEIVRSRPDAFSHSEKMLQRIGEFVDNSPPSFMYKVDLPDEHIAKMLDWDKPLSQQGALKSNSVMQGFLPDETGAEIYRVLSKELAGGSQFVSGKNDAAAEALRQAGIPGIRYLDGGSRAAGQGTANYVIFPGNEGLLTILERNGVPLR